MFLLFIVGNHETRPEHLPTKDTAFHKSRLQAHPHRRRIGRTNCTFQWQFVCSYWDECQFVSGVDTPFHCQRQSEVWREAPYLHCSAEHQDKVFKCCALMRKLFIVHRVTNYVFVGQCENLQHSRAYLEESTCTHTYMAFRAPHFATKRGPVQPEGSEHARFVFSVTAREAPDFEIFLAYELCVYAKKTCLMPLPLHDAYLLSWHIFVSFFAATANVSLQLFSVVILLTCELSMTRYRKVSFTDHAFYVKALEANYELFTEKPS